jgi:hypothetical protein
VGAGKRPIARTIQPSLGNELRVHTAWTRDVPFRALHQELALDELHGMHDDADLMPPLLLGTPPGVLRLHGAPCRGLGDIPLFSPWCITQERRVVPVDALELFPQLPRSFLPETRHLGLERALERRYTE